MNQEKIDRIVSLYKKWLTIIEISQRVKSDPKTVKRYLTMLCWYVAPPKKVPILSIIEANPEKYEELKQEYLSVPNAYFTGKYNTSSKTCIEIFWKKWQVSKNKYKQFFKDNPKNVIAIAEELTETVTEFKYQEASRPPVPQEASIKLPFSTFTL